MYSVKLKIIVSGIIKSVEEVVLSYPYIVVVPASIGVFIFTIIG